MPEVIARHRGLAVAFVSLLLLAGCDAANSPYSKGDLAGNVLFTSFQEVPKYLDPVSSYSVPETPFMYGTYEPPLHYHYLKRPYVLEGLTALSAPDVTFYDKAMHPLPAGAPPDAVAFSEFTLHFRSGVRYQPHPALARDASGGFLYQDLKPEQIAGKTSIWDFPLDGAAASTREMTSEDYAYQIKRLASPWVNTPSPVLSLMSDHIVGMRDLTARLKAEHDRAVAGQSAASTWLPWHDLRQDALEGVSTPDKSTLKIRLYGSYPQFRYWLAMTFLAPIPWEADRFYAQRGMAENTITLNLWPVGTGPFMLRQQDPRRYVMVRNPNYWGEAYPSEGEPGDREAGLLADAGKRMPFVDKVVVVIEKERETRTSKFMQGYYDIPELDRFDNSFQLVREIMDKTGRAEMLGEHGIRFISSVEPQNWYEGFNMLDPVVGAGATPDEQTRHRKLRQAISIATDWEEHSAIFFDIYGDSEVAMSAVPPGLFGYRTGEAGMNPVTHVWRNGKAVRRTLGEAKKLLAEAGYPGGRDARTGRPLLMTYDANGVGPEYQSRLDWQVKQMAKLGIQLETRPTDFNRFQERARKGQVQIYFFGWNADYPDAENFLALFPSDHGAVRYGGDNYSNYANPEYDRLYERMRMLPDGPERQRVIDQMVRILQNDAVWMFGLFPGNTMVTQPWLRNAKVSVVVNDKAKYLRVDGARRLALIDRWNKPQAWPLLFMALLLAAVFWPAWHYYSRRQRMNGRGQVVTSSAARSGDRGGRS
jgi:ABC-type transport system substrate-binding protein